MEQLGRELEQLLMGFHEDWTHEFDDPYALAESDLTSMAPERLANLRDQLSEYSATQPQLKSLPRYCQIGARLNGQEDFRAWLSAVQRRVEQRLAGDDSEPLVAPV